MGSTLYKGVTLTLGKYCAALYHVLLDLAEHEYLYTAGILQVRSSSHAGLTVCSSLLLVLRRWLRRLS